MTRTITKNALTLIATVALSAGLAQTAAAKQLNNNAASGNPQLIQTSTSSITMGDGQWRILPNGCSYSRTQAPGYAPTWILIVNPHHLGQPVRNRSCATMLQGS